MQNAAFAAAGIDAAYVAIDVPPERFARALAELHEAGAGGLNVTLPHKEAAFRLLERATPEAREAGAANTLRRTDGGWEGHATDGLGLLAWLDEMGLEPRGASVLLIGAGGAARSVAAAVLARGAAALGIVNRDGARARALAAEIGGLRPGATSRGAALAGAPAGPGGARGARWAILIRAVSAEAVGAEEERWWDALAPGAPAIDLNYGARAAGSRAVAEGRGLRFHDGLGLLLHQGALSFEFWTGRPAPREAMRLALEKAAAE
jgi:shikimate dehydrogenase